VDHLSTVVRRRGARHHARPDDGQAAVELALVLPGVVLLLLALVQFALVARDELLVVHAAREAARAASVGASGTAAASRVLPGSRVNVSGGARVGDLVVAVVSYRSVTDLPLIGPLVPDPWLHATVSMRTEQVSGP
jgi:Flp pilus assembly protein TadG